MKEIFLYVIVCALPLTNPVEQCREVAQYEAPDPISCQLERIPVSGVWRQKVEATYGTGYAIFTGCDGSGIEEFLKNGQ